MNRNIIITGGLGFIGSNLVELLISKKYSVINLDKVSYSSNFYNLKEYKNHTKYRFIKCDLNSKKILSILMKNKPICIFNLAAETHVDRSIDGPKNFINSNILGTFNLLEAFKIFSSKHKSKLVHISTDEVYGDIIHKSKRADENYTYKPSSPYSASKASSDHLVKSYVRTYNLPAIISNCSNNYGPRQFPEKLIPKLIFNILNKKPLPIYGKGLNSREWIYVMDHCEALFQVYKNGKIGEFYNIGSNKNFNNIQICKTLLKISKNLIDKKSNVKINFIKDRPGHDLRYALNSNKIKKKFIIGSWSWDGYKPTTFKEASAAIEILLENGFNKRFKFHIIF